MRYIFNFLSAVIILACSFLANADCMESAQTQSDMNQCAGQNGKKADEELNAVYKEIKKKYANQPEFLERIKNAQLAWIKFRDAELKALFPVNEPGYYGSVEPMCTNIWFQKITAQRVKELRRWLESVSDGEVCNGSIGDV